MIQAQCLCTSNKATTSGIIQSIFNCICVVSSTAFTCQSHNDQKPFIFSGGTSDEGCAKLLHIKYIIIIYYCSHPPPPVVLKLYFVTICILIHLVYFSFSVCYHHVGLSLPFFATCTLHMHPTMHALIVTESIPQMQQKNLVGIRLW